MRYELTDYEYATIKPMLPNKPRGVPRVNDRRILSTRYRPDAVSLLARTQPALPAPTMM
jgi:transposase